jgi:uncharacterized protein YjiK
VSIGDHLPSDYEASDIIWHPRLEKMFLVNDKGFISSMSDEGHSMTHWRVGGDMEGATIAFPQSDFIYLGNENPDGVYEFNLVTAKVTRKFDLSRWMPGRGNAGLEALTFVPDANDPEGGLFYAGLQGSGNILVFRLPVRSSPTSTDVTHIRTIPSFADVADISGLHYDSGTNVLYAIYDNPDLLRAMTPHGKVLRQWDLPGNNQEGLTFKEDELYLCMDNGKKGGNVFRYHPFAGISQPYFNAD